jgi:hypothetical protein
MTDAATTTEATAPATPNQATEQRATLLADPAWRQAALNPASPQWAQLQGLDAQIAGPDEPEEVLPLPQQGHVQAQDGADDDEDGMEPPAGYFEPPATPAGYTLPTQEARQAGLEVDAATEIALRQGFHAAGVDPHLATILYTVTMQAALKPTNEVQEADRNHASEAALRRKWGKSFAINLAAADAEARSIFAFMPGSITGGQSFDQYMRSSGLGNNRMVIEQLLLRAQQRARSRR